MDFEKQRDLIRTLVKRVEIDNEQVNVVFRVESIPRRNSLSDCGNGGRGAWGAPRRLPRQALSRWFEQEECGSSDVKTPSDAEAQPSYLPSPSFRAARLP
jgi:hypothetical protein